MSTPSEPIIYRRPLTLSNSVELYWYPPTDDGGNVISSYIIECANIGYINVLPSTDRKSIVKNLGTGNTYVFTIKATNTNGNGNISSFNFTIPGFKPDYPLNTDFKTHITDYSNIFFSFNDPIYIGNSTITYNTFTLNPVDITGNIMAKSPFILTHSAIGSNIIDPLYLERLNMNYDYRTYLQSENTVNCSDRNYFSTPINPNLPTHGLKLWLDPYDLRSLTIQNNKIVKWEDKSKNQSNASVSTSTFSPSSISGLQLWLDGNDPSGGGLAPLNGANITTWVDKSTNSRNATMRVGSISYDAINKGLVFNGSSSMDVNLTASNNTECAFVVVRIPNNSGDKTFIGASDNAGRQFRTQGNAFQTLRQFTTMVLDTSYSVPINTSFIAGFTNDGTTITHYANATSLGSSGSQAYTSGRTTVIGGLFANGNNTEFLNGTIQEIIIYTSLTQSDREKIEGYLAWKWGLQSNLPSNHPWKNISPLLAINYSESQGPTYDSSNALINFNGSQYLSLPANVIPSGNSSYSIFTYVSTSNIIRNNQGILYSGTPTANLSLGAYINSNTIVQSWINNQQVSNSLISANISYLVEFTYDSGIRKTFINDTLVGQDNVNYRASTSANNIIGSNSDLTGNLEGSIGDIIIYDRILSSLERNSVRNYLERKKYNLSLKNIGNVVTWLDATDQNNLFDSAMYKKISYHNNVSTWLDRSYANNTATQSNVSVLPIRRPYIQNNRDVLEFQNSYLTVPTSGYPLDAFIVLKLANNDGEVGVLGVSPNSNNFSSLSYDRPLGNVWYIGSTGNIIAAPVQETSANFLLLEWSIANNNNYIRRYGSNLVSDTSRTWTLPTNSNIIIGNANGFDFSTKFNGYIGEILMFNRQLEDGYRYPVEGYLAWKWGLQSYLADDHPFKNSAPYLFYKYLPTAPELAQFTYNGNYQTFTVPTGVSSLTVYLWGAGGSGNNQGVNGGAGAYLTGTLSVTAGETLRIIVGKGGVAGAYDSSDITGWGGNADVNASDKSAQGGGRSAIQRLISSTYTDIVTVGGGGGAGYYSTPGGAGSWTEQGHRGLDQSLTINSVAGGSGGGSFSAGGIPYYNSSNPPPNDIIISATGKQFMGGNAHHFNGGNPQAGGGGGGWYGGGGGTGDPSKGYEGAAGGGGSSNARNLTNATGEDSSGHAAVGTSNPYYISSVSRGGVGLTYSGGNGLVVFTYTFSTSGSSPFVPTDISGSQIWYDGADPSGNALLPVNGSTITTITDKSGNSRNATAGSGAVLQTNSLNSKPTLYFNGNKYYDITYSNFGTSYTFFAIFQTTVNTGDYQRLLHGSTSQDGYMLFGAAPGGPIATFVGTSGTWNDTNANSPSVTTLNTYVLLSVTNNGTTLTPYANGTAQNTKTGTTQTFNNFLLGRSPGGQGLNGNMAEMIMYSSVLSSTDRQKVEGYLAWKWGLQSNLPSDHAYKNAAP